LKADTPQNPQMKFSLAIKALNSKGLYDFDIRVTDILSGKESFFTKQFTVD